MRSKELKKKQPNYDKVINDKKDMYIKLSLGKYLNNTIVGSNELSVQYDFSSRDRDHKAMGFKKDIYT